MMYAHIIVKVLFAVLAFMASGLAFMILRFPIPPTGEPNDFDRAFDIGMKGFGVLLSVMAMCAWWVVFTI